MPDRILSDEEREERRKAMAYAATVLPEFAARYHDVTKVMTHFRVGESGENELEVKFASKMDDPVKEELTKRLLAALGAEIMEHYMAGYRRL